VPATAGACTNWAARARDLHNACATTKWNQNLTFPIQSGHGCIGCSEPDFWDKGSFYAPLSTGRWGSAEGIAAAAAVGTGVGIGSAFLSRARQNRTIKGG
jgi:hydrogenase small subunit